MPRAANLRLTELLTMLPEADCAALLEAHGFEPTQLVAAADALADFEAVCRRREALDPASRELLDELLGLEPGFVDLALGEGRDPAPLIAAVLLVAHSDDGRTTHYFPVEVRAALLDETSRQTAPVGALLAEWDEEELTELAALHGLPELAADGDTIATAMMIAHTLTDVERLDSVFDSLPAASKRLAHWLCEVEEPVPLAKAALKARRYAELAGDGAGTAERILLRLGIAHQVDADGDSLLVVPYDVRDALRPIIESSLNERCRTIYARLRDEALPAFRDLFPHGAGGNPLVAARQRAVRAALVGPDLSDRLDRILLVFRVLDAQTGVGELASLHLDVATPERFAQECLRGWLNSLDDDFTRILVEPFGADCVALADWILEGETPDEEGAGDADDWGAFLHDLRGNFLFALSLLAPGHWFPVANLVDLVAATYRRLLWHAGGFHGLSDDAPEHAFPMPGVEVTQEEEARLYEAVVVLLVDLLEPLGAVRMDERRKLFMVNTEALRLFRDGDSGFDTLWSDAEAYVGDDIDLWLPIPTSYGVRVSGVERIRWLDELTAELGPDAHFHDLLRFARWADPIFVGGTSRFLFGPSSVARGLEAEDPDEFLLWLAVRAAAPIPSAVRALFPLSSAAADSDEPVVAASRLARKLVDELDQWGEAVPIDHMEALRGLGTAAAGVVADALARAVELAEWRSPRVRHLAVLAGELGLVEAVPLLVRVLAHSDFEPTEGAAACALARLGLPAYDHLAAILANPAADIDKRLAAAGAISAMGVLHPSICGQTVSALGAVTAQAEDLPEDVPTLVGIFAAETGHPNAEHLLHSLRDQGLWLDDVMAFDEALWVAGMSPSVWGHPIYATSLAHLYPPRAEAERLRDEAIEPPTTPRRPGR